jgi:hypothetical protein
MIFEPGKKHLFLDISSTNIDTLVPSFCHQRKVWHQVWTVLRDKRFPPYTGNISVLMSFSLSPFVDKKRTVERCSSVAYSSSTVAILTAEYSLWTCACASAPTLSWSWTRLLPSDTEKTIISITAILLQFVTYLLTLPRNTLRSIEFAFLFWPTLILYKHQWSLYLPHILTLEWSRFFPCSVFMRFLEFSNWKTIFSSNSIYRLVSTLETLLVFCEVGPEISELFRRVL